MERAAIDRIQRRIEDELATRFPGSAVQGVALLQYGDDPEIEPGELVILLQIAAPGALEGDEAPDPGSDPLDMFRRAHQDRKSTRLSSSHLVISYAVFCLK